MAETKKAGTKKPAPAKFVGAKEFADFKKETTDNTNTIINMLTEMKTKPAEVVSSATVTEVDKEVAKADPNEVPINPEWDKAAREIIGEAVDHCEVQHIKSGGLLFTVVIKPEFSNAPKDYIERYKSDRRTREIGNEGFGGVELWCKLIKQNLARPNANTQK